MWGGIGEIKLLPPLLVGEVAERSEVGGVKTDSRGRLSLQCHSEQS